MATTVRLSKRIIKEARNAIQHRIKEVCKMTTEQKQAEVDRIMVQVRFTGTDGELTNFLLQDAVERAIPDSWTWSM